MKGHVLGRRDLGTFRGISNVAITTATKPNVGIGSIMHPASKKHRVKQCVPINISSVNFLPLQCVPYLNFPTKLAFNVHRQPQSTVLARRALDGGWGRDMNSGSPGRGQRGPCVSRGVIAGDT